MKESFPMTSSLQKKLGLSTLVASLVTLISTSAFAQGAADAAAGSNGNDVKMYAALGAGLCMGLAVLGGGLGQGRAAAAALEGIARNPGASGKITTPMILGLALVESLVLFALVIALMIIGKI
jgi:F-type H+-transporting ATPase subunit c